MISKTFRLLATCAGLAAAGLTAYAVPADTSPANFANVLFNGTLTGSTGGINGNGTLSVVFTGAGMDHTLSTTDAPVSDPVAYTYTKTGATTAEIVEPQSGGGDLTLDLTFSSPTAGTFAADYGSGKTQSGTFVIARVPAPAPLVNMSNRSTLAAGGSAIAGWVVGGNVPRRVLIRAVGPGLATYGVSNTLNDPKLTIFKNGQAVKSNDNWSSDSAAASDLELAAIQSGAFPLIAGSKDSAAIVTVDPGVYTAVITGSSASDSGDVLLETYFLD